MKFIHKVFELVYVILDLAGETILFLLLMWLMWVGQ